MSFSDAQPQLENAANVLSAAMLNTTSDTVAAKNYITVVNEQTGAGVNAVDHPKFLISSDSNGTPLDKKTGQLLATQLDTLGIGGNPHWNGKEVSIDADAVTGYDNGDSTLNSDTYKIVRTFINGKGAFATVPQSAPATPATPPVTSTDTAEPSQPVPTSVDASQTGIGTGSPSPSPDTGAPAVPGTMAGALNNLQPGRSTNIQLAQDPNDPDGNYQLLNVNPSNLIAVQQQLQQATDADGNPAFPSAQVTGNTITIAPADILNANNAPDTDKVSLINQTIGNAIAPTPDAMLPGTTGAGTPSGSTDDNGTGTPTPTVALQSNRWASQSNVPAADAATYQPTVDAISNTFGSQAVLWNNPTTHGYDVVLDSGGNDAASAQKAIARLDAANPAVAGLKLTAHDNGSISFDMANAVDPNTGQLNAGLQNLDAGTKTAVANVLKPVTPSAGLTDNQMGPDVTAYTKQLSDAMGAPVHARRNKAGQMVMFIDAGHDGAEANATLQQLNNIPAAKALNMSANASDATDGTLSFAIPTGADGKIDPKKIADLTAAKASIGNALPVLATPQTDPAIEGPIALGAGATPTTAVTPASATNLTPEEQSRLDIGNKARTVAHDLAIAQGQDETAAKTAGDTAFTNFGKNDVDKAQAQLDVTKKVGDYNQAITDFNTRTDSQIPILSPEQVKNIATYNADPDRSKAELSRLDSGIQELGTLKQGDKTGAMRATALMDHLTMLGNGSTAVQKTEKAKPGEIAHTVDFANTYDTLKDDHDGKKTHAFMKLVDIEGLPKFEVTGAKTGATLTAKATPNAQKVAHNGLPNTDKA